MRWRHAFVLAWALATLVKLAIAVRLPLFVDEAFYWQEGQHLAWAYSDLPGLTAWMTRLGVELGGHHPWALRLPFVLTGACIPWLVAKISARWFGARAGWQAGLLTVLMPLSGTLGLLALPDVPMAFATVLCLDAGARLLRQVNAAHALELAAGLAIGALSHYRFIGVIAVGLVALLLMADGRRILRDARVWVALAVGGVAWMPLLIWNAMHGEAGLRFQFVDRHPWAFHGDGVNFLLTQPLLVTPLLFVALVQTFMMALRNPDAAPQWRYFGLLGGVSTLGFFVLGFFTDSERVNFHWTLPGYLALLAAAPRVLADWRPAWRTALWWMVGLGLAVALAGYALVSTPTMRQRLAAQKFYPANFAGWDELAAAVREELALMPGDARLLADNFKLGAELGFKLGNPRIEVLDHPLNHKHGRAPQLRLWQLQDDARPVGSRPALLVIGASDVRYRDLLAHYRSLCRRLGPIVPWRVVNVDHGAQRFVLARLFPRDGAVPARCSTPSMAWIDQPASGAGTPRRFTLKGWAFREGIGLDAVEVLIDGRPVATARYGLPQPGIAAYWQLGQGAAAARIGFQAEVDAGRFAPGLHWLGLRLIGRDGMVETWAEQPIRLQE